MASMPSSNVTEFCAYSLQSIAISFSYGLHTSTLSPSTLCIIYSIWHQKWFMSVNAFQSFTSF